jgi:putative membrane protein
MTGRSPGANRDPTRNSLQARHSLQQKTTSAQSASYPEFTCALGCAGGTGLPSPPFNDSPFLNSSPVAARRFCIWKQEFHLGEEEMKRIFSVVCCIVLVSVPGLAQKKHAAKAGMGMTDQQFVDLAGQTDMVEANLGQLAQNVAASQQVKDYGQMLATDHTNDYQQLQDAAKQANLTVPSAIDDAHNKSMVGPMNKLKGAAFDHKYVQEMIAGHTKAIQIYKKEAQDAQNAAIKSYAETALPVLQKHLDGAKDLLKNKAK